MQFYAPTNDINYKSIKNLHSIKVRLHRTRSEGWQLGRSHSLLKIGKPSITKFCRSEVKQTLAKTSTGCNLSKVVSDVTFSCFAFCLHASSLTKPKTNIGDYRQLLTISIMKILCNIQKITFTKKKLNTKIKFVSTNQP